MEGVRSLLTTPLSTVLEHCLPYIFVSGAVEGVFVIAAGTEFLADRSSALICAHLARRLSGE